MPLLGALMLAAAAFHEQRLPLRTGWQSGHAWWMFAAPARSAGMTHYRLIAASGVTLWLNGTRLETSRDGEVEVSGLLRWSRPNLLIASRPVAAELAVTPRVFVSGVELRDTGSEVTGRVWIRNTLENTVNAFLTLDGGGFLVDTNATVPPGVTQAVVVRQARGASRPFPMRITLEKQEEAMEGGYRFEVTVGEPSR